MKIYNLQFQNKNNEMEKFSNEIEQENIYLLFQDNIKKIIKFNHSERIDLILNDFGLFLSFNLLSFLNINRYLLE